MSKKMVCKCCGSQDVQAQGWVAWDVETQSWNYVEDTGNYDWCNDCENETRIVAETA